MDLIAPDKYICNPVLLFLSYFVFLMTSKWSGCWWIKIRLMLVCFSDSPYWYTHELLLHPAYSVMGQEKSRIALYIAISIKVTVSHLFDRRKILVILLRITPPHPLLCRLIPPLNQLDLLRNLKSKSGLSFRSVQDKLPTCDLYILDGEHLNPVGYPSISQYINK